MQGQRLLTVFSAVALLSLASAPSFAQQSAPKSGDSGSDHGMMGGEGMMGGGGMMKHHGMMGGDTKGMMGRMHGCEHMRGSPGAAATMPHLPPGNEKLEFQMRAEMMQKMGEIMMKYAGRIKE